MPDGIRHSLRKPTTGGLGGARQHTDALAGLRRQTAELGTPHTGELRGRSGSTSSLQASPYRRATGAPQTPGGRDLALALFPWLRQLSEEAIETFRVESAAAVTDKTAQEFVGWLMEWYGRARVAEVSGHRPSTIAEVAAAPMAESTPDPDRAAPARGRRVLDRRDR